MSPLLFRYPMARPGKATDDLSNFSTYLNTYLITYFNTYFNTYLNRYFHIQLEFNFSHLKIF